MTTELKKLADDFHSQMGDFLQLQSTKLQSHVTMLREDGAVQIVASSINQSDVDNFVGGLGASDKIRSTSTKQYGNLFVAYAFVGPGHSKDLKHSLLEAGSHCPKIPAEDWTVDDDGKTWKHSKVNPNLIS